MVLVTREILSISNPSFRNIPSTSIEDTARRSRRAARRAALQARARRRAAQRAIQARRIAARRRARKLAQQRRRTKITPGKTVTERKTVGFIFRRGDPRTAGRFPIIKDVTTVTPEKRVTTIKTKRQLRVEALNRRFAARRKARAEARRRKLAARRAAALRRIAARKARRSRRRRRRRR